MQLGIGIGIGQLRSGGFSPASFSPATLYSAAQLGDYITADDDTRQWQNQAGSVAPVVDSPIGKINGGQGVMSWGPGGANDARRPALRAAGALRYWEYDGIDDGMGTGISYGATLMDLFFVSQRATTPSFLQATAAYGGGNFLGVAQATTSSPDQNLGTPTYFINGNAIDSTRLAIFNATTPDVPFIMEVRGCNMVSLWSGLWTGFYPIYSSLQRVYAVVARQTLSTDERNLLMPWLAAKAGITL